MFDNILPYKNKNKKGNNLHFRKFVIIAVVVGFPLLHRARNYITDKSLSFILGLVLDPVRSSNVHQIKQNESNITNFPKMSHTKKCVKPPEKTRPIVECPVILRLKPVYTLNVKVFPSPPHSHKFHVNYQMTFIIACFVNNNREQSRSQHFGQNFFLFVLV